MVKATPEEFPTVEPRQAPPTDYENIQAPPGAFGAFTGAAEQRAGAQAEQAGGELIQAAILKQNRWNQIAVDHGYNQFAEGVYNITYGDPNDPSKQGFFSKRGQDALTGARPTIESLEQLRQQIRGNLQNDAQRLEFDQQSRYLQMHTVRTIGAHADSQAQDFTNSVNAATIRNGQQSISSNPADEDVYQMGLQKSLAAGVRDL